jgi:uncharacterized membrane protein
MTGLPSEPVFYFLGIYMHPSISTITRMAILIALGISLGYALLEIPNVELITATVFMGGYLLGKIRGMAIGFITEALFSLFHPYGPSPFPLFMAQIVSMGFTGFLGGWMRKKHSFWKPWHFALAGVFSTALFAVLTTMSFVWTVHMRWAQIPQSFLFGLGFYILHLASNGLIFLTLIPIMVKKLSFKK